MAAGPTKPTGSLFGPTTPKGSLFDGDDDEVAGAPSPEGSKAAIASGGHKCESCHLPTYAPALSANP